MPNNKKNKKKSSANSKTNTKQRTSSQETSQLGLIGREVVGVILLSITVLFFTSIFTYHPGDISQTANANIHNAMGRAGAYMAYGFSTAWGITCLIVPGITFIYSILFIFQRPVHTGKKMIFGILLFLVFASSLLDLYFSQGVPVLTIPIEKPGGLVGEFINSRILEPFLGRGWGAYLFSVTGTVVTFMISTRFSFVKFFSAILSFLSRLLAGVLSLLHRLARSLLGHFIEKRKGPESSTLQKKTSSQDKKIQKEKRVEENKGLEKAPTPKEYHHEPIITRIQEKKTTLSVPPAEHPSFSNPREEHHLPPVTLLEEIERVEPEGRDEELRENSRILMEKLRDFGVEGRIVNVCPGPVITRYEFEPAPGVKINKVSNLSDDLALAMSALSVRIVAPIPGRSVVGIEIPNHQRQTISFKEIMDSANYRKVQKKSKLALVLGKDIAGVPVSTDLARMPHLLIAGSTGSGKSVSLNGIILSLLFNATPDELKLLMIDPKMLELGIYNGIPHLLIPPVTDPKKASVAMAWVVQEMEDRYCLLAERGVRNIDQYNRLMEKKKAEYTEAEMGEDHHRQLPYLVVIIDEFADLMMTSSKEVEGYITRLAQMARAVGIHLIIATQRPSVDVITGLIKANFPSRVSFRVASRVDSRTILDRMGAEKLLGLGDMLFSPPDSPNLERLHGPLVTEKEIRRIVKYLAEQGKPEYNYTIIGSSSDQKGFVGIGNKGEGLEEYDAVYDEAVDFVTHKGQASTSMIQRRFKIGYNRAANIIDIMEREGVVGPADGSKPRQVLVSSPENGL